MIWGEIVASISSKSAGPGTRANIDEFTETTSNAIVKLGGAERGKAIIILNPAEPPLIMRDTVFTLSQGGTQEAIEQSVADMAAAVQKYVPGYRLKQKVQFEHIGDNASGAHPRRRPVLGPQDHDLPRSRGRGALPAGLCRQSRHHDLGRARPPPTAGPRSQLQKEAA